jgi:Beta-propeller repeat
VESFRHTIILVVLAAAPALAQIPAFFIPNLGQTDPAVLFMVDTPDLRAGFTANSAIFQLDQVALRVRFAGANPHAVVEAGEPLGGHANFLIGNRPQDWKTSLPVYQKLLYRDLYPGIDMSYGGAGRSIKSEFQVAPGADPNRIRLDYSGAALSIAPNGDLVIRDGNAEAREAAPVIYQDTAAGAHLEIPGRYLLFDDAHTLGFEIAAYDHSRPLIIDPVLSYATYLGGTGTSAVTGTAVDSSGDLYVTGWTESLNFQIAGPVQASNAGGVDAFVAKLSPAGSGLLYATYIGGSGEDQGAAIAVDSSGEAYVTGSTASTNFPLVSAIQLTLGGGRDAFALKLNALGSMLLYSTYLGGINADTGNAIAVDSLDNAYIAGDTQSANFPILGAEQAVFGGGQNAFVTKLSSAGVRVFSTFLGGAGVDHAGGIAIDSGDDVYVVGGTTSTNFPVLGAIQALSGGGQDAFLTKLNSTGSAIVYSTYLGGSGGGAANPEQANAVAVDSGGNAYIAGTTNSVNFPVTAGAFQASFNSVQAAFAAKMNPGGSALVYSTYLGGSAFNWANGIAVAAGGIAYVAGYTSSFDFPTVVPVQASFGGLYDAFVAVFNAAGNSLSSSTFYGGSGSDEANAIAVDTSGNMYLGGQTNSLNLTLLDPIQATNAGFSIGWLARLGVASSPPPTLPAVVGLSPLSGNGNSATFTAQFSDAAGVKTLASVTLLVNTTASPNYGCQVTYSIASNQFALANDVASSGFSLVNPGGGNAQNDQCTLSGSGSYVTVAGTTITVVISVSFQAGFTGSDTVYLSAIDTSGNATALVSSGIWTATVPAPQPTASSVSPNASMGSSQTFNFVFSDTQNPLNITGMGMVFNSSLTFSQACYIIVDRIEGTIALAYDSALGSSSKPFSSSAPLQNSQCTVGAATLTISGLSDILSIAITFNAAFSGLKNIYMFGSESGIYETGWVQMGTYDVAVGGVPLANSVSPSSGTGPSQRFSFIMSDVGGASFLTGMATLISSSLNTVGACSLAYDRNANTISLGYDNPANGAVAVTPGSTQVVSNSQCTLMASDSTVVIGVTSVEVTLALTFNANFFGAKNIYMEAVEPGINSGWVMVGGWTVTGGAPEAVSVSPASGSGTGPAFVFTVSDSSSPLNISGMNMLITAGSPSNTANACYLVYSAGAATISLFNNAGTSFSTKAIGSSATLSNSQCAVGYTLAYPSGNDVALQVDLSFTAGFTAAQSVYLDALEPDATSGWVAVGSWTP